MSATATHFSMELALEPTSVWVMICDATSLPENGSTFGTSSPSADEQGLWSGEEGMGGTWSCGGFELLGGGEVDEGGGGGGGGGDEAWGVWADVGLLAADWDVLWLTLELDSGLVRSSPPTLAVMGEWRESFRVRTGEEVRDWMDRGGGEENLRQRRGDLSVVCSPLLLFWFVAKNSSKDLEGGGGGKCVIKTRR
ncbi:hypothetical protein EYF80_042432 [Liparis tanakae]|uniref:Uncharacterized protein n=1 Tax=Liparis tanakae TaxID=230148 RepID=A0A4Z2G2K4_9TELE|nr:hypothetical protein EYF80_042432 [Liparis tanakae]